MIIYQKMKKLFGVSAKNFDMKAKPSSNDIEAHEIAMDLEEKSFNFYKEISEDAKDHKIKTLFEALMHEEGYHYELIKKGYDFIKDPQGFYSEQEGWLLEG